MLSYVTMAKISISSIEFVINIFIQLGQNILPSYEMLSFGSNKMHFTVVASHISHDGIWCALLPKMFSCIICFSKFSYESFMAYALNEYAPWNCIFMCTACLQTWWVRKYTIHYGLQLKTFARYNAFDFIKSNTTFKFVVNQNVLPITIVSAYQNY